MVALIPTVSAEQVERDQRRADPATAELWTLLDAVHDPEVPVLSLWDLGVLRDIEKQGEKIIVTLTPTYSGCPAIKTMAEDVEEALQAAGYNDIEIRNQLAPAWTTDWLTSEGHRKLKEYGIAPPQESSTCRDNRGLMEKEPTVPCPQCDSAKTRKISEFGSTACKALYQCEECHEPFDYFKCL